MTPPPFSKQTIKRVLEPISKDVIVKLTERYIKIKSTPGKEGRLSNIITADLRKGGFTVEEVTDPRGGKSLISKLKFSEKGPQLMLGSYLDTYPLMQNWTKKPFKPVITKGRLFGLGALESKACLATVLTIFKALSEAPVSLQGSITLACLSDGKAWNSGINAVIEKKHTRNTSFCVMVNPTPQNSIMLGRLGRVIIRSRISRTGGEQKTEVPVNPIESAASIIALIPQVQMSWDKEYDIRGELVPREIHAQPSSVLGAEECDLIMDGYYSSRDSIPGIINKMKKTLRLPPSKGQIHFSLMPRSTPAPKPFTLNPQHLLVQVVTNACKSVYGVKPNYVIGIRPGAENYLYNAGISTITHGPNGSNAGSTDEFVNMASIEPAAHVITRTTMNLLK